MKGHMTGDSVYGGPRVVQSAPTPASAVNPQVGEDTSDPHDPIDKGPGGIFDDPLVWLIVIAALATGALGLRFRWWSSGVDVGARVKVGDEVTTLIGTTLYAITGIILFKIAASKVEVPGLQKLAAAI